MTGFTLFDPSECVIVFSFATATLPELHLRIFDLLVLWGRGVGPLRFTVCVVFAALTVEYASDLVFIGVVAFYTSPVFVDDFPWLFAWFLGRRWRSRVLVGLFLVKLIVFVAKHAFIPFVRDCTIAIRTVPGFFNFWGGIRPFNF